MKHHRRNHPLICFLMLTIVPGCGPIFGIPSYEDIEWVFNAPAASIPEAIAGEPIFREQPIFREITGTAGSHAATITAFPDGELLAAWYSYTGPGELDNANIYTSRRKGGDEQWQTPNLHIDSYLQNGNPVLYSEGDHVWMFRAVTLSTWHTSMIVMETSADRGHTWSTSQFASVVPGANVKYPPVRTRNGELLLPAYDDLWQQAMFLASSDGREWHEVSRIACEPPYHCIQPSIVTLKDGRLLAVTRNTGSGWLWATVSDDNGRQWARPIDSGFSNPTSATTLLSLLSGHLVLIFNDSETERVRLSIALSLDEGRTWPYRRSIAPEETPCYYPSATQTPDGLIHIVYSRNREYIQHVMLNEAWITSETP